MCCPSEGHLGPDPASGHPELLWWEGIVSCGARPWLDVEVEHLVFRLGETYLCAMRTVGSNLWMDDPKGALRVLSFPRDPRTFEEFADLMELDLERYAKGTYPQELFYEPISDATWADIQARPLAYFVEMIL